MSDVQAVVDTLESEIRDVVSTTAPARPLTLPSTFPRTEHERIIRAQVLTAYVEHAVKDHNGKLVLTEKDIQRIDIAWNAVLGRDR